MSLDERLTAEQAFEELIAIEEQDGVLRYTGKLPT